MTKCTYDVNRGPPKGNGKDTSFRSFICALLVFLALCIIIFLILTFVNRKNKEEPQVFSNNDEYQNGKIIGNKASTDREELSYGAVTTEGFSKTNRQEGDKVINKNRNLPTTTNQEEIYDDTNDNDIDILFDDTATTTERYKARKSNKYVNGADIIPRARNEDQSTTSSSGITTETVYSTTNDEGIDIGLTNDLFRDNSSSVEPRKQTDKGNDGTTDNPSSSVTDFEYMQTTTHLQQKPVHYQYDVIKEREEFITTANEYLERSTEADQGNVDYVTTMRTTSDEVLRTSYLRNNNIENVTVDGRSTTENVKLGNDSATEDGSTLVYRRKDYYIIKDENKTSATTEDYNNTTTYEKKNDLMTTEDEHESSVITENYEKESTTTTNRANVNYIRIATTQESPTTTENEGYENTTDVLRNNVSSDYVTEVTTEKEGYNVTSDVTEASVRYYKDIMTTESWDSSMRNSTERVSTTENVDSTTVVPLLTTGSRTLFTQPSNRLVSESPTVTTCNSIECKKFTSNLLYRINHAVDPCENFYDFACGGHEIDEELRKKKNLGQLINYVVNEEVKKKYLVDFKGFYQSCVHHERNFKYTGRLHILNDNPNMSLSELFAELILTQSMPFFDIGLDIDKKTQKYKFELTIPGRSSLPLDTRDWRLFEQLRRECVKEMEIVKQYTDVFLDTLHTSVEDCSLGRFQIIAENFVLEMMKQFERHPLYQNTNLNNLLRLINMTQALQSHTSTLNVQLESKKRYSLIATLNTSTGFDLVDWGLIFSKLTFNGTLDENTVINVPFPDYFDDLFSMLRDNFTESELTQGLWLYWKLQLYMNTVVPKETEDREYYCVDMAKQLMPDTASVLIYGIFKSSDQHRAIHRVSNLFREVKDRLEESLTNSKMDEIMKGVLKDKLKGITLGLITTGDNRTAVANNKEVKVSVDDYQANVVELLKNYRKVIYSLQGGSASAATLLRYFVDPFYTRPKSFYAINVIVAHPAFFTSQSVMLPQHINSATIVMHLAQELSRHFDSLGRQFLVSSSIQTSQTYYDDLTKRTKDLLEIYANGTYVVDGNVVNFKLNTITNKWINEMIADNAAFRLAFDSYSEIKNPDNLPFIFKDYSPQTVFFIAAAQEYCKTYDEMDFMHDIFLTGNLPPPIKVQNFICNSKEFSDTFQCAVGSKMTLQEELITQFPNIDSFAAYSYDIDQLYN